jgi:hypothetical protein
MNAAVYALPAEDWQHLDLQTSHWVETIPLYGGMEWLLSAANALANLSTLPDNWDGAGSPPIAPEVITKAIDVLCRFRSAVEPMSHVSPVPGGGLQLEWHLRDRYLEIEVFPDESVEYLLEARGQAPEEGTLLFSDANIVQRLVRQLSTRQSG